MAKFLVSGQELRTLLRTQHISVYLISLVAKDLFKVSGGVIEINILKYSTSSALYQWQWGWFRIKNNNTVHDSQHNLLMGPDLRCKKAYCQTVFSGRICSIPLKIYLLDCSFYKSILLTIGRKFMFMYLL